MIIKSFTIENVRGLQNHTIDFGDQLFPNKPTILFAPNGSGKTSLAIAFDSLKKDKIVLEDKNRFQNNHTNLAKITITCDDAEFVADEVSNAIKNRFATFVINTKNKPKSIKRNINGHTVASSKMSVDPIVLCKIPENVDISINNTFVADEDLHFQRGVIPSITYLFNNSRFFAGVELEGLSLKKPMNKINSFIQKLKSYSGTVSSIYSSIESNDLPGLRSIEKLTSIYLKLRQLIENSVGNKSEVKLYLEAIQLWKLYLKDSRLFKKKIEYSKYECEKKLYCELFAVLNETWQGIKPKEEGNQLIVEIDNSDNLSNGERDVIVFTAMLQVAKQKLNKEHNILIVDEIFDYLDDANMISAQYYISKFIEECKDSGRNIYPLILSHLSPELFRAKLFKGLKVYHFKYQDIDAPEKMKKLIRLRDSLEKSDKQNATKTDMVSKYMFHYHHSLVDLSATLTDDVLSSWRDVSVFKDYCKTQTEKYINQDDFDPIAVCVWLRECIEKNIYQMLPSQALKNEFYNEDQNGTKNKILFAENNGLNCPEVYYLLSLIYNDNLHLGQNGEEKSTVSLYSKLRNNTVRQMISSVVANKVNVTLKPVS